MELVGHLSNPSRTITELLRINASRSPRRRKKALKPAYVEPSRRLGDVRAAVFHVLQESPEALTVREVYEHVATMCDPTPRNDHVGAVLNESSRTGDGLAERVGYGKYRARVADGTGWAGS